MARISDLLTGRFRILPGKFYLSVINPKYKVMKKLFLVLIPLLIAGSALHSFAVNELFRSNASGSWNSIGTWQMSTNGGSNWIAATSTPNDTSGAVTVRSPNTVTVTASVSANQVTVESGATLNGGNSSGVTLSIYGSITNNGTMTVSSTGGGVRIKGPTLINNGTLTALGWIYFDTTTSVSGAGTYTPANTSISANGNITMLNSITYSPSTQIVLQSGGILNPNGNIFTLTSGSMYINPGATVSASGTLRTQNTVGIYVRAGSAFNAALNVNTGTTLSYDDTSPYDGSLFGNVTVNAGATLNGGNISGRELRIFGTLTNSGTVTASSTGGSLRLKGSVINNGAINPAGTLYLDSTINLSGNGTFTAAGTVVTGNVTLLGNITYSPTSYITVQSGGTLNPNGNTFTLTSGTMYVDAGGTVSSPGTIKTQNDISISPRTGSAFNAALIVNTGTAYLNDVNSPYTGRYYGNVTIDAGAAINAGAISGRTVFIFGNVINNGSMTATSTGGSLRIKGSSLINNGVVNTAGSFFFDTTTSLSGTGSFTSGVALAGNANVTLNSNHQMHAVTINTGTVFNISNRMLKLTASNPLAVSGTFTATGSTVEYNGSAAQTVSATNITYSSLKINNPSGTSLANNVTVNDSLIIQLGTLDLGTRILTVSPTGQLYESPGNIVKGTTGYLITTRSINAPSSLDVGGFGAVLTTSANLGSTEIRRGHSVRTGGSIKRYYDITPANNSGLNATLVFKYDDSELNLRPEKSLKLFKSTNSGSTWTNMGGTVNVSTNEITITGLSSFSRWTADSSGVSAIISFALEGYYNAGTNRLRMEDTVRIYLRNIFPPYSVVDSAVALLDSVLLKSAFVFASAPTGTYYIQIKHRNALETWSKSGGESYIAGNTLNYDFLTSAASAFNGNQIQVDASPLRFAFYSGDVTQDGAIDAVDVSIIENAAFNFLGGYVVTDVSGDRFVDATDVAIADNNALNYISVQRP